MKSRRKKQLARLQKKEITLQQAWNVISEELDKRDRVIYFVSRHLGAKCNAWDLHDADENVLVIQTRESETN
ncbi:hypothetical protein [Bacillus wiedmannii]|uniref:hypothetical protein n=1 Tax=Bacillus wiedmannii TaxID=1890302 RepID=UPI000BF0B131|nr:hypothetical protein [Bacillus wiedmannii]PEN61665.1 hypothetical protein CN576_21790 [Bacillus wiedmannii]PHA62909.1 hypothetical protein COE75_16890 [Bacillus wiedmannii]